MPYFGVLGSRSNDEKKRIEKLKNEFDAIRNCLSSKMEIMTSSFAGTVHALRTLCASFTDCRFGNMFRTVFRTAFQNEKQLTTKWSLMTTNNSMFHTSAPLEKRQASRYKKTLKHNNPLTYEQANAMYYIGVRKSWNSWNTSNLEDGLRKSESALEDFFIRKFLEGTWHRMFLSNVIIKRRANLIVIGGIINRNLMPRKIYFLTGYTEEILSYLFKCPVKIELQTIADRKEMIVKYV